MMSVLSTSVITILSFTFELHCREMYRTVICNDIWRMIKFLAHLTSESSDELF